MSTAKSKCDNEEVKFNQGEELGLHHRYSRSALLMPIHASCEIAGYTGEELVGQNHNIIRTPDMPQAAYADMWGKT